MRANTSTVYVVMMNCMEWSVEGFLTPIGSLGLRLQTLTWDERITGLNLLRDYCEGAQVGKALKSSNPSVKPLSDQQYRTHYTGTVVGSL